MGILEILPRIHVALSGVKQAEDVGGKKNILKRSVDLQTNHSEMMEKQIHLEEEEGERWMR